ncbi:MAG TPA: phosphotransferase family protein [Steroidobacteraceae bacterium]|nr:phosphotransferase family protein [Steroidobacteraceae bacterium]
MSTATDESKTELRAEGFLPGNDRLLRGVQATLRWIRKDIADAQSLHELNAIDCVLSELASREETRFYLEHYRALRSLLAEGLGLIEGGGQATKLQTIRAALSANLPESLEAALSFEAISIRINEVMRLLATLIAIADTGDAAVLEFMARVSACENNLHIRRVKYADTRKLIERDSGLSLDAQKLTAYLRERFPDRRGIRVTNFKQLVGGFQKVTILFETIDDEQRRQALVMRAEKNDRFMAFTASDIRKEFAFVKALFELGIPVAEPLWLEDDERRLGQRFFVSRKLAGENYGSAVTMDKPLTDEVMRSFVEAIAKVHLLTTDSLRHLAVSDWLSYPTPQDNWRANIDYWRNQLWMKAGNPSAIVDRLAHWLRDNVPQERAPLCLIHGDYGPHNVLVDQGAVTGIVDWEMPRIGDPAEDIAWFLQACGGKADYRKVLEWYAEITGHRISEYRLRYYDVFGCLKLMAATICAEATFEHHEDASIVWLLLPYRMGFFGTSTAEARIEAAEALKHTQARVLNTVNG